MFIHAGLVYMNKFWLWVEVLVVLVYHWATARYLPPVPLHHQVQHGVRITRYIRGCWTTLDAVRGGWQFFLVLECSSIHTSITLFHFMQLWRVGAKGLGGTGGGSSGGSAEWRCWRVEVGGTGERSLDIQSPAWQAESSRKPDDLTGSLWWLLLSRLPQNMIPSLLKWAWYVGLRLGIESRGARRCKPADHKRKFNKI